MGLDPLLFRTEDQGGKLELVKESQRRRYKPEEQVNNVVAAYEENRRAQHAKDQAKSEVKKIQDEITAKKKAKQEVDEQLLKNKTEAESKVPQLEKDHEEASIRMESAIRAIGNIVHQSVPVSKDEKDNLVVKQWGDFKTDPEKKHHHEVLGMLDGYESARGVKVAGHRGYFLKGVGVQLNFAIMQYGMDFLNSRDYTMLQPPYLMNRGVMSNTAQLEEFDEALYKINLSSADQASASEETEKYLIATSEQPISALHQGEWLDPKNLPIRYGGVSTCFRKEAGAHGKDTWGIFRVHQFEKIEQFCITSPETSWEMHEKMLEHSEEFYQSLGIPYRVVSIVSGALNNAAAKKYDLEGWFPSFNEHRELVSCSNCTDYQSRSMEIRYGSKKQNEREKKYVHMLNSTLCATTRTICAILENYQTPTGVQVPEALQKYMGGKTFMEFKIKYEDLPTSKGAAKKK
eukprot:TRINITY_DN9141_c0_g1_i1.p1 TRINITY_DN9141_c0_g1~~TRINITY_DN9141_c0_g1_i1.p1  ORF type:complete len:497 (+),score=130.61 TRINITY_DN9141_c0_g1_i1:112-1491(+)